MVIINETTAKHHFGSPTAAIGKRLSIWSAFRGHRRDEKFMREIVGVVGDTKTGSLTGDGGAQIYVPHAQDSQWNFMGLVIRTAGDPAAFAPTLRREVQALDKDQPIYNVRTMDDVVANSLGTRRVSMQLFAVFRLRRPAPCRDRNLRRHGLLGHVSAPRKSASAWRSAPRDRTCSPSSFARV